MITCCIKHYIAKYKNKECSLFVFDNIIWQIEDNKTSLQIPFLNEGCYLLPSASQGCQIGSILGPKYKFIINKILLFGF